MRKVVPLQNGKRFQAAERERPHRPKKAAPKGEERRDADAARAVASTTLLIVQWSRRDIRRFSL
jgi:hypothetical protein